jgi:hypothetical protein
MVMDPAREREAIDALTMNQIIEGSDEILVGFEDDAEKGVVRDHGQHTSPYERRQEEDESQ